MSTPPAVKRKPRPIPCPACRRAPLTANLGAGMWTVRCVNPRCRRPPVAPQPRLKDAVGNWNAAHSRQIALW